MEITNGFTCTNEELMQMACPAREDAPFFNHCMSLARDRGLNWEQALAYVIEQRRG